MREYAISLWSPSGNLLRRIERRLDSFRYSPEREDLDASYPPSSWVKAIREDGNLLWTVVWVADRDWRKGIRAMSNRPEQGYDVVSYRLLFDSIVEVFDHRTGRLIASRRFDQAFFDIPAPNTLAAISETPLGEIFVDVYRFDPPPR